MLAIFSGQDHLNQECCHVKIDASRLLTQPHSFSVKIPSGQSPHHLQCIQSKLYTKSALLDGPNAGRFTDVGRVSNSHICSRLCCEDPTCDLAYMFSRTCFLVRCNSEKSCRTVPDVEAIRSNSSFDRSIQYIVKRHYGIRLRDGKSNNSQLFIDFQSKFQVQYNK